MREDMPNPTSNSGIRDNHKRGAVADFLKAKIQSGSRLSVVSAYFTISAYDALREHLDQIEHLDFLFGDTSALEREIDQQVYALYGLTPEEIAIVEGTAK